MAAKFTFEGLDELKAQLRDLPKELTVEAGRDVEAVANGAAATVMQFYGQHRVTGNLVGSVRVTHGERTGFTAKSTVRVNSPIAWLFDNGSETRQYITAKNGVKHLTGRMPGFHIFDRTMSRARYALHQKHWAMLERHGLVVTGG